MIIQSSNPHLNELSKLYVKYRKRCFFEGVCTDSCILYIDELTALGSKVWKSALEKDTLTQFSVSNFTIEQYDRDSISDMHMVPLVEIVYEIKRTCNYANFDTVWMNSCFRPNQHVYQIGDIIKEWEVMKTSLLNYNSSHSSSSASSGRSNLVKNTSA